MTDSENDSDLQEGESPSLDSLAETTPAPPPADVGEVDANQQTIQIKKPAAAGKKKISQIGDFSVIKKLVLGALGALGVGSAAASGVGARKMMVPKSAERLLWKLLFAVGGYIILGIGLTLWYYLLVRWLAESQLGGLPANGLGIY